MKDDLKLPDPASGMSVAELHFASLAGPDPGIWTVWRLRIRPTVTSANCRLPLRGHGAPRGGGVVKGRAHIRRNDTAGSVAARVGMARRLRSD